VGTRVWRVGAAPRQSPRRNGGLVSLSPEFLHSLPEFLTSAVAAARPQRVKFARAGFGFGGAACPSTAEIGRRPADYAERQEVGCVSRRGLTPIDVKVTVYVAEVARVG
jgi:hypothetical protein